MNNKGGFVFFLFWAVSLVTAVGVAYVIVSLLSTPHVSAFSLLHGSFSVILAGLVVWGAALYIAWNYMKKASKPLTLDQGMISNARQMKLLDSGEKVMFTTSYGMTKTFSEGGVDTLITNRHIIQIYQNTGPWADYGVGTDLSRKITYDQIVDLKLALWPLSSSAVIIKFGKRGGRNIKKIVMDGLRKEDAQQIYDYIRSQTKNER